jgi:hypothetical protein
MDVYLPLAVFGAVAFGVWLVMDLLTSNRGTLPPIGTTEESLFGSLMPVQPRVSRKRLISLPFRVWLPLVAAMIALAVFAGDRLGNGYVESARRHVDQATQQLTHKRDETLKAWLDSQRKGNTGYDYWLDEPWVQKVHLFALQSYEIVDQSDGDYTVRIHSSTKGGSPVVCLWKISITLHGRICSIRQAEEDTSR